MTYKEYIKATIAIDKKYTAKRKAVADEIQKMEDSAMKSGRITPADEKQLTKLYEEAEFLKNKHNRSIYRLKLNFAKQDSKVKVGDIIWAVQNGSCRVMRVESERLAAFDYPMLKYFGLQLTMRGLPSKVQKQYPQGGIYVKDITSINGEPFEYKEPTT